MLKSMQSRNEGLAAFPLGLQRASRPPTMPQGKKSHAMLDSLKDRREYDRKNLGKNKRGCERVVPPKTRACEHRKATADSDRRRSASSLAMQ